MSTSSTRFRSSFATSSASTFTPASDETRSLPEQKEELLLWGIYKNGNPGFYRGAHVVHGHEQVSEPAVLSGRTNLDIGAFYSGKLAIGVFDKRSSGRPDRHHRGHRMKFRRYQDAYDIEIDGLADSASSTASARPA